MAHTHTYMRARARTNTHTHTHTHIGVLTQWSGAIWAHCLQPPCGSQALHFLRVDVTERSRKSLPPSASLIDKKKPPKERHPTAEASAATPTMADASDRNGMPVGGLRPIIAPNELFAGPQQNGAVGLKLHHEVHHEVRPIQGSALSLTAVFFSGHFHCPEGGAHKVHCFRGGAIGLLPEVCQRRCTPYQGGQRPIKVLDAVRRVKRGGYGSGTGCAAPPPIPPPTPGVAARRKDWAPRVRCPPPLPSHGPVSRRGLLWSSHRAGLQQKGMPGHQTPPSCGRDTRASPMCAGRGRQDQPACPPPMRRRGLWASAEAMPRPSGSCDGGAPAGGGSLHRQCCMFCRGWAG